MECSIRDSQLFHPLHKLDRRTGLGPRVTNPFGRRWSDL